MRREESAGYMTNLAARLFVQMMERTIRPHGVAVAYVPVFFALSEGREMTQAELARHMALEQPTMAATLARMERDGMLVRRPDPRDGRKMLVGLAPEARDRMEAVARAVVSVNGLALAGLTDAERKTYLRLLAKIVSNLEAGLGREP